MRLMKEREKDNLPDDEDDMAMEIEGGGKNREGSLALLLFLDSSS